MKQLNVKPLKSRRGKEQILELLSKYDQSPKMTVKSFCKLHQISEACFYSWRKRYRSWATSLSKQPGFISIARPAFKDPACSLFAEVNGIKLYQAVTADYLKALVV